MEELRSFTFSFSSSLFFSPTPFPLAVFATIASVFIFAIDPSSAVAILEAGGGPTSPAP